MKRRLLWLFVIFFYVALAFWIRLHREGPDWGFFLSTARIYYEGRPLELYSLRFVESIHGVPYGPLFHWVMLPGVVACVELQLPLLYASILPWLGFLVFDLLLAFELIRHIGPSADPKDEWQSLLYFTLFLSSWMLLFASPYHGHFETMPLFFFLVGVRFQKKGRDVLAGVMFALALLSKQSVIPVLIAHWAVLGFAGGWRRLARTLATTAVIGEAVMLPYILADPRGVYEQLIQLPQVRRIAFQTTWLFLPEGAARAFVTAYAEPIALAIIIGLCIVLARRRRIQIGSTAGYGLMAMAAVIVAWAQKWGSLHYFVQPFVVLLIWEARRVRFPWCSVLFMSVLSNIFILWVSRETEMAFSAVTSVLMIVLFLGTLIYVGRDLREEGPEAAAAIVGGIDTAQAPSDNTAQQSSRP